MLLWVNFSTIAAQVLATISTSRRSSPVVSARQIHCQIFPLPRQQSPWVHSYSTCHRPIGGRFTTWRLQFRARHIKLVINALLKYGYQESTLKSNPIGAVHFQLVNCGRDVGYGYTFSRLECHLRLWRSSAS
ncbi:hypothetical protein M378DRAFT_581465 [Amanita muscaria Koide BX008]|uniref:Secreted protein n=1 Tax=Amanita muscaria (strain Koide BX008) TaxID=946122 RepID=A0A0C2TCV5_AMAMK|nr:hypothetical protein M378DRAFT_581465 [Amanita muscaria Koide BX008]